MTFRFQKMWTYLIRNLGMCRILGSSLRIIEHNPFSSWFWNQVLYTIFSPGNLFGTIWCFLENNWMEYRKTYLALQFSDIICIPSTRNETSLYNLILGGFRLSQTLIFSHNIFYPLWLGIRYQQEISTSVSN